MSSLVIIEAKSRSDLGKGASRRLRREGLLPSVVYGGSSAPCAITLSQNQIWNCAAKEWFYSHILDLQIDGKVEKVIIKDMQRHPFKTIITHVDFQRVVADQKMMPRIPVHFLGEEACVGVKAGGLIVRDLVDIEISCLPQDLPEVFVVDVSHLEIGQSVHLSDLTLPEGVELPDLIRGHNQAIASVIKTRAGSDEDAAEVATEAEAE